MDVEAGDFHFSQRGGSLECRGQRNGAQTLNEGSPVHSAESYRTAKTARKSSPDRGCIDEESSDSFGEMLQSDLDGGQNGLIGACQYLTFRECAIGIT